MGRVDAQGAVIWQHVLDTAAPTDRVSVAVAPDGAMFAGGTSGADSFVVRLDPADGRLLWTKSWRHFSVHDIAASPDGGVLVCGSSPAAGDVAGSGWAVRLDGSGAEQWHLAMDLAATFDKARALPGGGWVLAAGREDRSYSHSAFILTAPVLLWLDTGGAILAARSVAEYWFGNQTEDLDVDTSGNVLVTTWTYGTSLWGQAVIAMFSPDRDLRWRRIDNSGRPFLPSCVVGARMMADGSILAHSRESLSRLDADGNCLSVVVGAGAAEIQVLPDGDVMGVGGSVIWRRDTAGRLGARRCAMDFERECFGGVTSSPPTVALDVTASATRPADGSLELHVTDGNATLSPDCFACPGSLDQTDTDGDGRGDACDSCPDVTNTSQADADDDGAGDACDACTDRDGDGHGDPGFAASICDPDACPDLADAADPDADSDGFGDACDICPAAADDQRDSDRDGFGDACDACPSVRDDQADTDGDGRGDRCDDCPSLADDQTDTDADGVGDACDDCLRVADPRQRDADVDGAGDLCDACPALAGDQADSDRDGAGDACDDCASANPGQFDCDGDGVGDACQPGDTDGDGVPNATDDCACAFNASQRDQDADGIGDACDPCPTVPDHGLDTDSDGRGDACDNCPLDRDPAATDADGDGWGDACDDCQGTADPEQRDADGDGTGDACQQVPEPSPIDRNPGAEPLRIRRTAAGGLGLTWETVTADAYDVYRGTIASLARGVYDHERFGSCGAVAAAATVPDAPGGYYFLVTARSGALESSYGRSSMRQERVPARTVCP